MAIIIIGPSLLSLGTVCYFYGIFYYIRHFLIAWHTLLQLGTSFLLLDTHYLAQFLVLKQWFLYRLVQANKKKTRLKTAPTRQHECKYHNQIKTANIFKVKRNYFVW